MSGGIQFSESIVIEAEIGEPEDERRQPESEWSISIGNFNPAVVQEWEKCSIYRIPRYLNNRNKNAYVPQSVSIGPYHHGDERLREMEEHKIRGLMCMLNRENKNLKDYVNEMTPQIEERARACYEGLITMTSNEFIKMMIVDGCFMIELFRGFSNGFNDLGYKPADPVFSSRRSMDTIRRDMILLENQIPFFILDLLFCLQHGQSDRAGILARLALQFFNPLKPTDCPTKRPNPREGALHCLELFRRSLLHQDLNGAATQESSHIQQQFIHSVTKLRKRGIKFKKGKGKGFWDIRFKDGTLEIPRLVINHATRSLFLNLLAFEKFHHNCTNHVTSYVRFMNNLIDSAEDVEHLHNCRILDHWLGSNVESADLINQLCREEVSVKTSYLGKLSQDVNSYSDHKWNCWVACLELQYFNNPWSIISLIAAFILLLLTLAQTLYTIFGYYRLGS